MLRLINLNQSLWLDEAINVVHSQKYNFWDFVTVYSLGDFHPPLHFAILWIWTHLFGTSEIIVRIPSVIFGVLTVWFTYLIGKNLFSKKIGLIAAVILAFNPLHVYYSQEARMYSLAAFSVVFSFWALINFLKEKKYFGILYGLSVLLILYSDYLVYFALISQFIYVVWLENNKLGNFIKFGISGSILWLPWLLIFPNQLKTGQIAAVSVPGWANVVGGANLKELGLLAVKSITGKISFDNNFIYGAVVLGPLAFCSYLFTKSLSPFNKGRAFFSNENKETKLLLLWIFLPVVFAFLISFFIPIFAYFRMIFILPGLALLFARGIDNIEKKFHEIIISAIILISLGFLFIYYSDPQFHREDWKGAMLTIESEAPPYSLILFEDTNIPAPAVNYYFCDHGCNANAMPALKSFPAKSKEDVVDFEPKLKDGKVYLFQYLVEISDPKRFVAQKLESLGFKIENTYDFDGVGFVYEYSK